MVEQVALLEAQQKDAKAKMVLSDFYPILSFQARLEKQMELKVLEEKLASAKAAQQQKEDDIEAKQALLAEQQTKYLKILFSSLDIL